MALASAMPSVRTGSERSVMTTIAPWVPIGFLNTGFHFPETLAYRDEIVERFGLKLREMSPSMPRDQFAREHGLKLGSPVDWQKFAAS